MVWVFRGFSVCVALAAVTGCTAGLRGSVHALPDMAPVHGATVTARLSGSDAPEQAVTTGRNGRFTVKGLEDGIYDLSVRREGFAELNEAAVHYEKSHAGRIPLFIDRLAWLGGTVFSPEGVPLEGAEIAVETVGITAVSNGQGQYSLRYIAPGSIRLFAVSGESASGPVDFVLTPGANVLDIHMIAATETVRSWAAGTRRGGARPLLQDGSQ
ncbi:carboxypeptidase regulatory-like domain-containing protein [bacterium]|nr:carboxypeptidase regulatory-like domain-containing protein [candidate division CSSED10-310 bacterium]